MLKPATADGTPTYGLALNLSATCRLGGFGRIRTHCRRRQCRTHRAAFSKSRLALNRLAVWSMHWVDGKGPDRAKLTDDRK
jgi:hypothetical protein